MGGLNPVMPIVAPARSLGVKPNPREMTDIPHVGPLASYPFYDWTKLPGVEVEVLLCGTLFRRGYVDAATADGKIAWIAQDGPRERVLIDKASGFEIRLAPHQLRAIHYVTQAQQFLHKAAGTSSAGRRKC
ncbi:hypothetical protein QF038_002373 [Pseudarthrobacter sp. W1I19]|nr:hypothetical protein [Pseudarthrobacter sp. W1I19]